MIGLIKIYSFSSINLFKFCPFQIFVSRYDCHHKYLKQILMLFIAIQMYFLNMIDSLKFRGIKIS